MADSYTFEASTCVNNPEYTKRTVPHIAGTRREAVNEECAKTGTM